MPLAEATEAAEAAPTGWRVRRLPLQDGVLRLSVRRVAVPFWQAIARLERDEARKKAKRR